MEDMEGLTPDQIKDVLEKIADDLDSMIDQRKDHNLMKPKVINLRKMAEKVGRFVELETK